MRIFDISQEVFGCAVFPGDPAPQRTVLQSMEEGSLYNLTAFSMCAHNGTHLDAPAHFLKDGKTVEGAFSVLLEDAEAPVTMTEVQFSFQNPHLIYAILVAVPTAFLLCVACYFLIARRRVV